MKIINLRIEKDANAVYCGRGSYLGNHFRIGVDGTRAEVIAKYRRWLWEQIQHGNCNVLNALERLREDSILSCYCTPEPCHCEVIIRAWKWLQTQRETRREEARSYDWRQEAS